MISRHHLCSCFRIFTFTFIAAFACLPRLAQSQDESENALSRPFLLQQDKQIIHQDIAEIKSYLESHPNDLREIQRRGIVSIIVDASMADDKDYLEYTKNQVKTALEALGLETTFLKIEFLDVQTYIGVNCEGNTQSCTGVLKEIKYILGVFRRSLEVLQVGPTTVSLGSKVPGMAAATIETSAAFTAAHANQIQMNIQIFTGIGLNVFHGTVAPIWIRAMRKMVEERGKNYQAIFDFAYGQFWGVAMRMNAWTAGVPNTTPDLTFFATSFSTAALGSYTAALGYEGMNDFVQKKNLHGFTQLSLQILRDTLFAVAQTRLSIGDLYGFTTALVANQVISGGLYLGGKVVLQNPKLVFIDENLKNTPEFAAKYAYLDAEKRVERSPQRKFVDRNLKAVANGGKKLCALFFGLR